MVDNYLNQKQAPQQVERQDALAVQFLFVNAFKNREQILPAYKYFSKFAQTRLVGRQVGYDN